MPPCPSRAASCAVAALSVVLAACGGDNLSLPDLTEPAQLQAVSGTGQAGSVGALLADPLVVRVLDSEDRPVPRVRIAFVPGSGAAGSAVQPDTAESNDDGRASVRWALGTAVGGQTLMARVVGNESVSTSFSAVAGASVADHLEKVGGDNQTAVAGSPLPDSLLVRAVDAGGRPTAGVTVNWAAVGGGSVSAPNTVTGADGRTGVRRTLGPASGEQTATAALAEHSDGGVTFSATATVGSAGALRIQIQPAATAQSGVAFSRQPQLQLVDGNNNPVLQSGLAVSARIGSGPSGSSLIGSSTASTNDQGLAIFTNLGISGSEGSYTLAFSGPGASGAASSAIQLSAGEAVKLAMVTQPPQSVQAGAILTPAPAVRLEDATGNGVSTSGVAVTVSLTGEGTLGGTLTVSTDANGRSVFPDLTISAESGDRALLFSGNGLQSIASSTVTVITAPDGDESSIDVPGSVAAGELAPVTVTVRSAHGSPLAGIPVTLSADGSENSIAPSAATTSGTGTASFTFSSTRAEQKSLTARAGELTIGPVTLAVEPGNGDPAHTTAVVPEGRRGRETTITVEVHDQFDNRLTAGGSDIRATLTGTNRGWSILSPVTDHQDGTYSFGYVPVFSGEDQIAITLDGTPIKNSPFTSKVK